MAGSLNIDISKFVEIPSTAVMADSEKKYAANMLIKVLTEGLYTDITLEACESSVKAHHRELADASIVFHALFKHEMKKQITWTLKISDMSMEGLQLFLVLLYISANEVNVDVPEFEAAVAKHWVELFQTSQLYDVADRLKCILVKALPRALTSANCWDYGRLT